MATYAQTVLADNPVLYLRFSETSGAVCADSSTSGFTGTASGAFTRNVDTGVTGWGIGISLGGAGADHVTVPDNPALDILGAVTFEAVIKPTSLPPFSVFMSKGAQGAALAGYSFQVSSAGTLKLQNAWSGVGCAFSAAGAVVAGTEYHVAATVDGSSNGIVYVNGVAGGTTVVGLSNGASGQPFTVGATSTSGAFSGGFQGLIDEVAVYNGALSAARIAAHYAARNTASGGGGTAKSSPGAVVSALAQARNIERKAERHDQERTRRIRLDYLHKRRR
jgi:hypothetical protein